LGEMTYRRCVPRCVAFETCTWDAWTDERDTMKIGMLRRNAGKMAAAAGAMLVLGSVVVSHDVSAAANSVVPGGDIYATNKTAAQLEGCSTEWHWVINGVSGAAEADLPSAVAVTWSDDSSSSATLDEINGGTAHYSTTDNMPPVLTVKEAKATWPNPTGQATYINFVLSHTPCPVEETTTTVEETTTTVEETTTTVEETTTSVESEVPTTAGQETTTTEKVESQSPGGELPATGSNGSSMMLVGGLVFLAGGSLAMALGRRTRHA
jgi:LPXTG-motif cell wall-anchored protein